MKTKLLAQIIILLIFVILEYLFFFSSYYQQIKDFSSLLSVGIATLFILPIIISGGFLSSTDEVSDNRVAEGTVTLIIGCAAFLIIRLLWPSQNFTAWVLHLLVALIVTIVVHIISTAKALNSEQGYDQY